MKPSSLWLWCLAAALCFTHPILVGQTVQVVQTTPDLSQALQPGPALVFSDGSGNAAVTISVNDSTTYQQMDGFGASLTDSSAWLIYNKLTAGQRTQVMQQLFDASSGIGLSFLRQPMGASDFALNHYSYDDMPPGQTDPNLTQFSIAHDQAYILPVLQQALSINPRLKVMATPWSPPGWMKTSGSLVGGTLLSSSYTPLANYFVKFVQAYHAAGVPVYAVTMQNEPLYIPSDYPGMGVQANEQASFLKNSLGPAFAQAGITTKILVYDHNWDQPGYPTAVLNDAGAAAFAPGTAFHCYAGTVTAQTTVHDQFPHKDLWETECSGGSWQSGNVLAQQAGLVIDATRNWAKAVVLWNLALDQNNGPHTGGCGTCRGVITIDTSSTPATVTQTVDYFALGHASKFVWPDAYHVEANVSGSAALQSVAFRNPEGSVALLALNIDSAPLAFDVRWAGKYFSYTLPSGSVATFTWVPGTLPAVALSLVPSGLSLTSGESGRLNLSVQPVNGLLPQVTLSCTGAPLRASCTVTPSSISFSDSTPVTVVVEVTTTGGNGAITGSTFVVALLVSGLVVLGLVAWRMRARVNRVPDAAVVILIAGALLSCGGGSSPPQRHGTTPGTYTLTITATPNTGAATPINFPLQVK